MRKKREMREEI